MSGSDPSGDQDERERRRAMALRENLKRRKAQQRARTAPETAEPEPDETAEP